MTIVLTAMIGKYCIMAADRKESYNLSSFIGRINQKLRPPSEVNKIVIANNNSFSGTGSVRVLNVFKKYFKNIALKTPHKLYNINEYIELFNKKSDFDGLNFCVISPISDGFISTMYYYLDKKYTSYMISSNMGYKKGKGQILGPSDIIYNDLMSEYLNMIELLSNEDDINEQIIIDYLKVFFKRNSKKSKYVSSNFDIVFHSLAENVKTLLIAN